NYRYTFMNEEELRNELKNWSLIDKIFLIIYLNLLPLNIYIFMYIITGHLIIMLNYDAYFNKLLPLYHYL
ncbi:MAG TPA: hypothetical protein PK232_01445, partial [Megamonas funiformis]|nr:hypothetical protein [Megamonas funiformis]